MNLALDFDEPLLVLESLCYEPEEQEWVLETEYSNKHRLKGAGIENRQAAIR